MTELLLFSISFFASYAGVAAYIRYSSKRGLLDVPNDRSSHQTPTPRGGGLVIVTVSLFAYCIISTCLSNTISWGYVVGALIIALVSWFDDLYSVSFIIRFFIHSAAASTVLVDSGYWNELYVPGTGFILYLGTFGVIITFFWIVWMINAYNFMDGIDGIAGLQAVLASTGWLIFALVFDYNSIYLFAGVLLFTNLGFLLHNWSPAKIFMGDVGSAFLGFTFAVLPIMAFKEKPDIAPVVPVVALFFVWFFIFDTILTLFLRLLKGERVWIAHRGHLYQRLVFSGRSHGFVAAFYGSFTAVVVIASLTFAIFRGNFEFLLISIVLFLTAALLAVSLKRNIDLIKQ
ncbi:MAG: glycosyltransferase family 4 protein [Saprospiraceae bacterium]|nr:glycosyltransferase family 4 protein [Pyrinomonadaceae bacterium]